MEKTKRSAIIVDIDGTVADSRHRVHHIVNPEGKVDWAAWDASAHLDPPIPWAIEMVRAMARVGHALVFITGRGERLREVTEDWLHKHVLHGLPCYGKYDRMLLMRADGDHRQDTEVKEEIYQYHVEPVYSVLFAIDDKASVVDHWRKLGVPCLECDRWTKEMEEASKHYVKPEHKVPTK